VYQDSFGVNLKKNSKITCRHYLKQRSMSPKHMNLMKKTQTLLHSPIKAGMVLLAPLGSTTFNFTMLSITDGGPAADASVTADEKAREMVPFWQRIRLDTRRIMLVSDWLSGDNTSKLLSRLTECVVCCIGGVRCEPWAVSECIKEEQLCVLV
jgi:hypothetical protein